MLFIKEKSHTLTPAGSISNKDITPAGTIGTHSLTVAELPAHSHGRGTTNITGTIYNRPNADSQYWGGAAGADGCFSMTKDGWNAVGIIANSNSSSTNRIHFDASSKWSGTSESKGSGTAHGHSWTGTKNTHNHTFTGSSFTFDNNPPYKVAYCFKRIN